MHRKLPQRSVGIHGNLVAITYNKGCNLNYKHASYLLSMAAVRMKQWVVNEIRA